MSRFNSMTIIILHGSLLEKLGVNSVYPLGKYQGYAINEIQEIEKFYFFNRYFWKSKLLKKE